MPKHVLTKSITRRFVVLIAAFTTSVYALSESKAETLNELLEGRGIISKDADSEPSDTLGGSTYYESGLAFNYPSEGVFSKVNGLLQNRYAFTDFDHESVFNNRSSFTTQEARIILSGSALYDEFRYMLETNFASHADSLDENKSVLEDGYLIWGPCTCSFLKFGHFQTPFVRQQGAADQHLQFTDKAIAAAVFDKRAQGGVLGEYKLIEGKLSAAASMFNGDTAGEGSNRAGLDTKHLGFLELRTTPLGVISAYDEGDFDWTEDLALSAGAIYGYEEFEPTLLSSQQGSSNLFNADINLKFRGASLHAEVLGQDEEIDNTKDASPIGFYIQTGYFIVPREIEIAARYSSVDCDSSQTLRGCDGNDQISQTSAGLNYYWDKNIKTQLNYEFIEEEKDDGGDNLGTNRILLQLSLFM